MMTHRNLARLAVAIGVLLVSAPRMAAGQDTTVPPDQNTQGPLKIEKQQSGFVVAPDFKFTEVNRDFANLAGVYGGWMADGTFLIGAGGYWLTNQSRDFKMAYGGFVLQWLTGTDRRVTFGARSLVGGGEATLSSSLTNLYGMVSFGRPGDFRMSRFDFDRQLPNGNVIVRQQFFIVDPQIDLFLNLTGRLRLDWGVGYRLIGGARGLDDRLRGVTGSVALQIGGGS